MLQQIRESEYVLETTRKVSGDVQATSSKEKNPLFWFDGDLPKRSRLLQLLHAVVSDFAYSEKGNRGKQSRGHDALRRRQRGRPQSSN
ncbi:hypothetical protein E2542_SST26976 [Spatholobus suberectus]|nr:hypothetical protein E2542_SST26976 [Spatholobus suberectus]